MENLKIRVNTEKESKEAQELFFELGYTWHYNRKPTIENIKGVIKASNDGTMVSGDVFKTLHKEITLPALRDMVVLKRNDVRDATHTDQDDWKWYIGADSYVWQASNAQQLKQWDKSSLDIVDLKPIEKEMKEYLTKIQDGSYKLIPSKMSDDDIEVPEGADIAVYPHFSKGISFFKDGFRFCFVDSSSEWENTDYCSENLKHWESWRVAWQRESLNDKVSSAEVARQKHNHYKKDVSHLKTIDVYRVLDLFDVDSHEVGHAIKKLLCSGQRGSKDHKQDVQEAIDSLNRHLEMLSEDEAS